MKNVITMFKVDQKSYIIEKCFIPHWFKEL
jgi:hypothetical protein